MENCCLGQNKYQYFILAKWGPFMEKNKSMLDKDLLVTSTFFVITVPIVITFLLAALIAGFAYLWSGGDTNIIHS